MQLELRWWVITCMINHIDHAMQLATVRTEPFNQCSWIVVFPLLMEMGECPRLFSTGPLYSVIVITPASETKVPRTFAIPRGLRISTTSNLHKTAFVFLNTVKIIIYFIVITQYICILEHDCHYKCHGSYGVDDRGNESWRGVV